MTGVRAVIVGAGPSGFYAADQLAGIAMVPTRR
jgi:cation diffusion facilitator CzcD-associated flavoprotein CzcO